MLNNDGINEKIYEANKNNNIWISKNNLPVGELVSELWTRNLRILQVVEISYASSILSLVYYQQDLLH